MSFDEDCISLFCKLANKTTNGYKQLKMGNLLMFES